MHLLIVGALRSSFLLLLVQSIHLSSFIHLTLVRLDDSVLLLRRSVRRKDEAVLLCVLDQLVTLSACILKLLLCRTERGCLLERTVQAIDVLMKLRVRSKSLVPELTATCVCFYGVDFAGRLSIVDGCLLLRKSLQNGILLVDCLLLYIVRNTRCKEVASVPKDFRPRGYRFIHCDRSLD
ncbi:hypothetical protein WT58_23960 [Burkholderia territorii]|nr:hypothetical protein WT58_23960 [Burkholderia territorii]